MQAFCEDSFDGDFGQQLKKGLDELLIVKLWKKGATTEVILIVTVQGIYRILCLSDINFATPKHELSIFLEFTKFANLKIETREPD